MALPVSQNSLPLEGLREMAMLFRAARRKMGNSLNARACGLMEYE
jgi:hypothetical protein